jgi:hypothetical protein
MCSCCTATLLQGGAWACQWPVSAPLGITLTDTCPGQARPGSSPCLLASVPPTARRGLCRVWQWHCRVRCCMPPGWDLVYCARACGVGKATGTGHEQPLPSVEERMGPLECFLAVAAIMMGWRVPSALRLAAMDRHWQTPQVVPSALRLAAMDRHWQTPQVVPSALRLAAMDGHWQTPQVVPSALRLAAMDGHWQTPQVVPSAPRLAAMDRHWQTPQVVPSALRLAAMDRHWQTPRCIQHCRGL